MLSPVPDSRRALATQAPKVSRPGAWDDEIGFLGDAVFEYSGAVQHEAAAFACNLPDDPLETDEGGRAVIAVHHQVFDMPLARDIATERLCDGGPRQFWQVLRIAIGLLLPTRDAKSRARNVLHTSTLTIYAIRS